METYENNPCLDEDGHYPIPANKVVDQISSGECDGLKANKGFDGKQKDNCVDLTALVCDIKQDADAIAVQRNMVVAANEASKCDENDDPTLASMWSRILRYVQATTCVLCEYDPFIAKLLKSGRFPQVLIGAREDGGYPEWKEPDTYPTRDSKLPVTSNGVYRAVRDAILGVWHGWEENPEFDYFAQDLNGDALQSLTAQTAEFPPEEGDTALVTSNGTSHSVKYVYRNKAWQQEKVFTLADGLRNFVVTHINKGFFAGQAVYYFLHGETPTWQVMDADLTELEHRIDTLEEIFSHAVLAQSNNESYLLTTRDSLSAAKAVPATEGRITITLITG